MDRKLYNEMLPHKVKLVDLSMSDLKLKVWWIPQVPMRPFEVIVSSFATAKTILETLAQYDLFQLANNIKPDYSNAGGLMVQEDDGEGGEWSDFDSSKFWEGDDFDDLTMAQCLELDALYSPMKIGA